MMTIQIAFLRKALAVPVLWCLLLFMVSACSPLTSHPPRATMPSADHRSVPRLAFTIQAGAFAQAENAARLAQTLQERGLNATYFGVCQGLYKVRFGSFPTRELARAKAESLQAAGFIDAFYIVAPEEYALARISEKGERFIREELVRTARTFLGVPYLWGGTSADGGFDCSGLTMTVYQLNGFDLPRTSRGQFAAGTPVGEKALGKGDLLFFAPEGGKVSHVGIYIGNRQFIHASGKGKRIRTDSLAHAYFRRSYHGARSYL